MECKCGSWLIDEEIGSYYEDNNFVEKYAGSCPICGKVYEWEYVKPLVKGELRNFKECE